MPPPSVAAAAIDAMEGLLDLGSSSQLSTLDKASNSGRLEDIESEGPASLLGVPAVDSSWAQLEIVSLAALLPHHANDQQHPIPIRSPSSFLRATQVPEVNDPIPCFPSADASGGEAQAGEGAQARAGAQAGVGAHAGTGAQSGAGAYAGAGAQTGSVLLSALEGGVRQGDFPIGIGAATVGGDLDGIQKACGLSKEALAALLSQAICGVRGAVAAARDPGR